MTLPTSPRQRGRPRLDAAPLSRAHILAAATHLLAAGATDVSMRAVAGKLGVDAMALYHYFRDKQALKAALVEQAFMPLLAVRPQMNELPDAEGRLHLLATTYLRCASTALPLTRHLAVRGGEPLAAAFAALFDEAMGSVSCPSEETDAFRNLLVDYLHGVALAGPEQAISTLQAGWPVLMGGLRPYLTRNISTQRGIDE